MVPAKQKAAGQAHGHHPHGFTSLEHMEQRICTFNILNSKPPVLQLH